MYLRTARRALQTLVFEGGGVLICLPIYILVLGGTVAEGVQLFVAIVLVCLVWTPLHNSVFDRIDLRLSGRRASDRPHSIRILHAVSHEGTSAIVTIPVIMLIGGFGFREAVLVDIGLTLVDLAYAYLFHLGYDRWRPVGRCNAAGS